MKYRYTKNKNDYSDLASGKVLFSIPGISAFPVRLFSEVFQTSLEYMTKKNKYTIFDPCCGSAYHLTALAFLHPDKIEKIICSDVSRTVIQFAEKNLNLLNPEKIDLRIQDLKGLLEKYNKQSHLEALDSSLILKRKITSYYIETCCYEEDLFSKEAFSKIKNETIDLIFADIPYGNIENWQGGKSDGNEIWQMLENLKRVGIRETILIIASTKKQQIEHEDYLRIKQLKVGKRKITFLKKV